MATSELLLIQPVDSLGAEGDRVKVKAGYARNYLLPRKFAVPVTRANSKQIEALKVRRAEREAKNLEDARAQAAKIAETHFAIAVKTGESGKMFGAVTAISVHEKLVEAGFESITRKQVKLDAPIKEIGQHSVSIKVYQDVEATLRFDVVSENPIVEGSADAEEVGAAASED
ncbi:MAG: 50S ribosomal protein L9 [Opitutaceae bacterium]|nr:50S ribosomal protein L9 [Opitutaceae bacterium]|tara:strand:+ start:231 stop:746 length:516 start_codon:yes stop_codon:yes gene_type:complete